jgi:hypothetical protein
MKRSILLLFLVAFCSILKAQPKCPSFKFDILDSAGNSLPVEVQAYTIMYRGEQHHNDTLKRILQKDENLGGFTADLGCAKDTVRFQRITIHNGTKTMVMIAPKRGFPAQNDLKADMQVITISFRPDFTFYWDGGFDKDHNMLFRLVNGIKTK